MQYINAMVHYNTQGGNPNWDPFPVAWMPEDGVVNENLLGWRPSNVIHRNGLARLRECNFENDNTIAGRLCHSQEATGLTTAVRSRIRDVKTVAAIFEKFTLTIYAKLKKKITHVTCSDLRKYREK